MVRQSLLAVLVFGTQVLMGDTFYLSSEKEISTQGFEYSFFRYQTDGIPNLQRIGHFSLKFPLVTMAQSPDDPSLVYAMTEDGRLVRIQIPDGILEEIVLPDHARVQAVASYRGGVVAMLRNEDIYKVSHEGHMMQMADSSWHHPRSLPSFEIRKIFYDEGSGRLLVLTTKGIVQLTPFKTWFPFQEEMDPIDFIPTPRGYWLSCQRKKGGVELRYHDADGFLGQIVEGTDINAGRVQLIKVQEPMESLQVRWGDKEVVYTVGEEAPSQGKSVFEDSILRSLCKMWPSGANIKVFQRARAYPFFKKLLERSWNQMKHTHSSFIGELGENIEPRFLVPLVNQVGYLSPYFSLPISADAQVFEAYGLADQTHELEGFLKKHGIVTHYSQLYLDSPSSQKNIPVGELCHKLEAQEEFSVALMLLKKIPCQRILTASR